ncbi:MAG: pyrimidine-nucleoside phosphorylase [Bacillota bacterium]
MRAPDLIKKKRDGGCLTREEIRFILQGYTDGYIPDYQMAALAMAIYFRGLDTRETVDWTLAMAESGDTVDLSWIKGVVVDKHSTGGVGDTTTLVLAPLVAAAGVPVAKMSGRGLGHTGGTLDKLESIPGFSVQMSRERFVETVNRIGVAVIGQTADLVPADKKLYALRDVTGTVESIPLIASSVMSKKIAAGAGAIVLDVKVGDGAFMKTEDDAFTLARTMVDIGEKLGRKTVAVVTRMDEPLGKAIGNVLEVQEAMDTLKGVGPGDLEELCLVLGGYMLLLAGRAETAADGSKILHMLLDDHSALHKFGEMLASQGGDMQVISEPGLLPRAPVQYSVPSPAAGYVYRIAAEEVGLVAMSLGAGRAKKEDEIDPAVGVVLTRKAGDFVSRGETLAVLHARSEEQAREASVRLINAYEIGPDIPQIPPLIRGVVTAAGEERYA